MFYGKMYEEQERKDEYRNLLTAVINGGGMGVENPLKPDAIMPLFLIDNMSDKPRPIINKEEAIKIYNQLVNG